MNKISLQRHSSFLGLFIFLLSLPLSLVEAALALAWLLRVLEIGSVLDRWLPGFSCWHLLSGVVTVGAILWVIERLLKAMTTA